MAVEALTIVNGPMAGIEENWKFSQVTGWMRSNNINPTYVGAAMVAGALFSKRGIISGAAVWGSLVFTSLAIWNQIR